MKVQQCSNSESNNYKIHLQSYSGKISKQTFKRAFTTKELHSYQRLLEDSRKVLGLKDTEAIIFDFNVPALSGKNTGIGTTWSDCGIKFAKFLKQMTGITSIQLGPQGEISINNVSPYSSTNWALGTHIIDLQQLEHLSLLPKGYTKFSDKNYKGDLELREYKTDYSYALKNQELALRTAFSNFTKLPNNNTLKQEFYIYKTKNKENLLKHSLFFVLKNFYHTDDMKKWDIVDKELFNSKFNSDLRQSRLSFLQENYKNEIEYCSFTQFIASKQQARAKEKYNALGLKLYGDKQVGFSDEDVWANKDFFVENQFYGAIYDESGFKSNWRLCIPNYNDVGECDGKSIDKLGKSGKMLYNTFLHYFKRYDGIRVDAADQYVTPTVFDENDQLVDVKGLELTVFNIIKKAATDSIGKDIKNNQAKNIMLELIGNSSFHAREITKNVYPHIYTTMLSYENRGPKTYLNNGYKSDGFYIGPSCHDNETLVQRAREIPRREQHFSDLKREFSLDEKDLQFRNVERYNKQTPEAKRQEDYRTLKFSEAFTTQRQFYSLTDAFGMEERINVDGEVLDSNWKVRIPSDYERFYHLQLSVGYGLNMPKVLANAMKMRGISNSELIKKLEEAADILRTDGPMTRKEADSMPDKLGKTFSYSV